MTTATGCRACGAETLENARFCHACGSPVDKPESAAEYKQVTVLFADVVRSMDIASAVGAERLREIMGELVARAAGVVSRYGGTLDKFTGDGVMAVFGAPIALEDHAFRACLTALDLQAAVVDLADDVARRDGIDLRLRVGLNSGEVIAGEIGSGAAAYTAIGEQVGMAQRMESAAPPGGVMLSISTARLVETAVELGDRELVNIKGAPQPVPARRLLSTGASAPAVRRDANLVGRQWELAALTGMVDRSVAGSGAVVGLVGPAGVGKSRLTAETAAIATGYGVPVFTTFCESHAGEVPFHVVARLLRAVFGVDEIVDDAAARTHLRSLVPGAPAEDVQLLDDLLGIREATVPPPDISPDARRRRLTALVNSASLGRSTPAVFIIEDVHWIDRISESMLADFLAVIPQTPSLVVITYRPEYRGDLSRTPGSQTIALAPLNDSETSSLVADLVGDDPSLTALTAHIAGRAAGNPFFAQEIVRDLGDRGVLVGQAGAYRGTDSAAEVTVPATLYATIAARIDRLDVAAKRTLSAAAVIGMRFTSDLLDALIAEASLPELVQGEFIDQVRFTPSAEYAFRHPLIRAVAYEAQLKADRAASHRLLAAEIEQRDPASTDTDAALIAEHLESAGDLFAAYSWHMRAGIWLTNRDIAAAHTSWRKARAISDRLPHDVPNRLDLQIAPRTLLCASAFRLGGSGAELRFDELRDLCEAAGDKRSLAIGMTGQVMADYVSHRQEGLEHASEHDRLLAAIGDPALTVGLSLATLATRVQSGDMHEIRRLTERIITLADGDPRMGDLIIGSPLAVAIALHGVAGWALGLPGWREDFRQAIAIAVDSDPTTEAATVFWAYVPAVPWILPSDATTLDQTARTLARAEQSGDDLAVDMARCAHAHVLVQLDGPHRDEGLALLRQVRDDIGRNRFSHAMTGSIDITTAVVKMKSGDLDDAIEMLQSVLADFFPSGEGQLALASAALVEALVGRDGPGDVDAAETALARALAAPMDVDVPGYHLHHQRMRALIARARGDQVAYRSRAERYRAEAESFGYVGHIAAAEELI